MTWVKLDDGFGEHPKVLGLSDAAFRLHVLALCYAARNLTDGVIPRVWLKGAKSVILLAVEQLIMARLWAEHPDGWEVHDYLTYQQSRAQVEQSRERNNDRVKRHRNALQDRPGNGSETLPRIDPDPEKIQKRTAAATSGSSLAFTETHRGHINGFCQFVCFSEQKAQEFAKTLAGGTAVLSNFDTVVAWAAGVRDSWGNKEIAASELKWYDFWEARWKEKSGTSGKNDAVLKRLVERFS